MHISLNSFYKIQKIASFVQMQKKVYLAVTLFRVITLNYRTNKNYNSTNKGVSHVKAHFILAVSIRNYFINRLFGKLHYSTNNWRTG